MLCFFSTNSPLELNNSIAAFLPVIKVEILNNNNNNMMFNNNYFPYTTEKINIPVNQRSCKYRSYRTTLLYKQEIEWVNKKENEDSWKVNSGNNWLFVFGVFHFSMVLFGFNSGSKWKEQKNKKKVIPSHKTGNEICICNERIGEEGSLVSGWEIFHDLNTDVTWYIIHDINSTSSQFPD